MDAEVTWNGTAVKAAARRGAAAGLTTGAERVRAVSVSRTPLDVGDLRSSQLVGPATEHELVASVSTDLPYAARQHEDLQLRHRHGRAKFLESAVADTAGEVQAIIATAIKRTFGSR
ncbi:hypothetical protein CWIS_13585 [Cellulomonas sp. A375-1]|uniref:hypothetical protein n=1 Tax=Cellulomonas sp. A375-1 TaxID=1672219 RepID=UPI000652757C|nr:hypothetical protein [Cellulomonas sp. A375-1]KMM44861.1 hypothetical protein CWIS_13585 [Cellulomonas sp. A375-1]